MPRRDTSPLSRIGQGANTVTMVGEVRDSQLLHNSLSARVILFSLLVTVLVTSMMALPLIANYSITWLKERSEAAYLIAMALEESPNGLVDTALQSRLLRQANILGITILKRDGSILMLGAEMPLVHDLTYDLRQANAYTMLKLLLQTVTIPGRKIIHVTGEAEELGSELVEIDVGCHTLFTVASGNTQRAVGTALITALLVSIFFYGFLQISVVQPLQRLTRSIIAFRKAPEDASRAHVPSGRVDEIGIAEQAFVRMQGDIRNALRLRAHLAAIGGAVARIQHDLRGLLASAMVMSDPLETSRDPEVKRIAPGLMAAIDRAVELCRSSVSYARNGAISMEMETFTLAPLVDELAKDCQARSRTLINQVPPHLQVVADRFQLYRALDNLVRNALEAGAQQVTVAAWYEGDVLELEVADDGPGIPEKIVNHLFTPFVASTKIGSTGLGLSITREIVNAHGGEIELHSSAPGETVFRLWLPHPTA